MVAPPPFSLYTIICNLWTMHVALCNQLDPTKALNHLDFITKLATSFDQSVITCSTPKNQGEHWLQRVKARKVCVYVGSGATQCVLHVEGDLGKCYMLAHGGKVMGWRFWFCFFNLFLQSATFVLSFLDDVYDQEDSNALKNTSLGYYMQKLQGFEVAFGGDLKPTPIGHHRPP